eukprot:1103387-Amphidinium_carterae.1
MGDVAYALSPPRRCGFDPLPEVWRLPPPPSVLSPEMWLHVFAITCDTLSTLSAWSTSRLAAIQTPTPCVAP